MSKKIKQILVEYFVNFEWAEKICDFYEFAALTMTITYNEKFRWGHPVRTYPCV